MRAFAPFGGVGGVFHDLERLAVGGRGSGCRRPGSRLPSRPSDPLVFAGLVFAAVEPCPELAISGALAFGRVDEHAVMLAADLRKRIADRVQEIGVRRDDRAIQVELDHRLRLADRRDLAGRLGAFSFSSVTSDANFTTLKGLPFSSRIGL